MAIGSDAGQVHVAQIGPDGIGALLFRGELEDQDVPEPRAGAGNEEGLVGAAGFTADLIVSGSGKAAPAQIDLGDAGVVGIVELQCQVLAGRHVDGVIDGVGLPRERPCVDHAVLEGRFQDLGNVPGDDAVGLKVDAVADAVAQALGIQGGVERAQGSPHQLLGAARVAVPLLRTPKLASPWMVESAMAGALFPSARRPDEPLSRRRERMDRHRRRGGAEGVGAVGEEIAAFDAGRGFRGMDAVPGALGDRTGIEDALGTRQQLDAVHRGELEDTGFEADLRRSGHFHQGSEPVAAAFDAALPQVAGGENVRR